MPCFVPFRSFPYTLDNSNLFLSVVTSALQLKLFQLLNRIFFVFTFLSVQFKHSVQLCHINLFFFCQPPKKVVPCVRITFISFTGHFDRKNQTTKHTNKQANYKNQTNKTKQKKEKEKKHQFLFRIVYKLYSTFAMLRHPSS